MPEISTRSRKRILLDAFLQGLAFALPIFVVLLAIDALGVCS